jgi:PhnB protein
MLKTNLYLNFAGNTEQAFLFYQSVFGGQFSALQRFSEVPGLPGSDTMSQDDLHKIMHIALDVGSTTFMGTDVLETQGHTVVFGTNMSVSLQPQTRTEARDLFEKLSTGGKIDQPLEEMFWGALYGSCTDQFGIKWMINCEEKA